MMSRVMMQELSTEPITFFDVMRAADGRQHFAEYIGSYKSLRRAQLVIRSIKASGKFHPEKCKGFFIVRCTRQKVWEDVSS